MDVGDILNSRYRIERLIGRGGMGCVYLATHLQLDESVAIKEMLSPSVDPETRASCEQQFRIEARILNRLRHPNLPRVYDYFEVNGRHYLVMEFIDGHTLDDLRHAPSEAVALQWAGQLCDVLGYLHSHDPQVVFRDLKPGNIMLDVQGHIKLIDFGIAKVFDPEQGASTKTVMTGAVSHGYAAPEQYGLGGTDARADIYSLGATLYALLSGHTPASSMEVAAGLDYLVPLNEYRIDLSSSTYAAIDWMLQSRREMRPPTMAAVQEALGLTRVGAAQATLPQQVRSLLREEFTAFFPCPDWIGRPQALDSLCALLRPVSETLPMVALTGEPGLGKSRLLAEMASALEETYNVLPTAFGSSATRQVPFGLVLSVVSSWMRPRSLDTRRLLQERLSTQELHELVSVLPELKVLVQDRPPAAQRGPLDRARSVMAGLQVILEVASENSPVLLVLDDMQWTDDATIRLLDTIRAGPLANRVAVLMAVDSDESNPSCADFMDRWSRKGALVVKPVEPLSPSEVHAYLKALLPPIQGLDSHVELLFSRTHGNPLLLEETIRFMIARRWLTDHNGGLGFASFRPDVLPTTLPEVVRRRREHLPVDAQLLLSKGAVIGKRFDLRTLLKLTGQSTSALSEALATACDALFVTPNERGVYQFTSEATRQVFYESLSAAERTELHRQLGTMEESRGSNSRYHFQQAGDLGKSLELLAQLSQDLSGPSKIEVVVGDAIKMKAFKDTVQLSAGQVKLALTALSMLVRSMKSLEVYGEHSPITQTSFGTSLSTIQQLIEERGTLGYSVSEEAFHINQNEVPLDQLQPDVQKVLTRHRISGFEFQPGVTEIELREFVMLLMAARKSIEQQGGWMAVCKAHDVVHIVVNETVYIGVAEKDLFSASKLKMADEVVIKSAPSTEEPSSSPSAPPLERVDGLLASATEGVAELQRMVQEMKQAGGPATAFGMAEDSGLDPELQTAVHTLLRQAQVHEIMQVVDLMQRLDVPFKTFLESRPETLLQRLESPDEQVRTLAAMGLMKLGHDARHLLLGYLRTSEHPLGRATAIFLLTRSEADPATVLAREVVSCPVPEEAMRLLQAMQFAGLPWATPIDILLVSPQPALRRMAHQVLLNSQMPAVSKLETLLALLQSSNLRVLEESIGSLGQLGQERAIGPLQTLLNRLATGDEDWQIRIQEQICHALGRIGGPNVLPILKTVLKKSLLGTGWDASVRAAALLALTGVPGTEARDLIRKHLGDPDPAISASARQAMATEYRAPDPKQYDAVVAELQARGLPGLDGQPSGSDQPTAEVMRSR